MNKPYRFTIICRKTGKIEETNHEPLLHHLQSWEPTDEPNVRRLKQTKDVWEDTRYAAKLRLYNYLTYTKNGLPVPNMIQLPAEGDFNRCTNLKAQNYE